MHLQPQCEFQDGCTVDLLGIFWGFFFKQPHYLHFCDDDFLLCSVYAFLGLISCLGWIFIHPMPCFTHMHLQSLCEACRGDYGVSHYVRLCPKVWDKPYKVSLCTRWADMYMLMVDCCVYEIGMSRYAYMDRLIMGRRFTHGGCCGCHGQCFHLSPLPHRGTCVCMYCFWCVMPNGDLSLCSPWCPEYYLYPL